MGGWLGEVRLILLIISISLLLLSLSFNKGLANFFTRKGVIQIGQEQGARSVGAEYDPQLDDSPLPTDDDAVIAATVDDAADIAGNAAWWGDRC